MKKPSKRQHIPTAKPPQQSVSSTSPALRDLTDADLEHIQGGIGIFREPTQHPAGGSVPPVQ